MTQDVTKVTVLQMIRSLENAGYHVVKMNARHQIYKSPSGRRVTIPKEENEFLHPRMVKAILSRPR
ncbi:MAG: type II toxin-antitoxin system HicA family toxin [Chloroflexi bacterium]|nr:type II toxin-antitoxin system HicA family toxin [Chloroflexota bacterium]